MNLSATRVPGLEMKSAERKIKKITFVDVTGADVG